MITLARNWFKKLAEIISKIAKVVCCFSCFHKLPSREPVSYVPFQYPLKTPDNL